MLASHRRDCCRQCNCLAKVGPENLSRRIHVRWQTERTAYSIWYDFSGIRNLARGHRRRRLGRRTAVDTRRTCQIAFLTLPTGLMACNKDAADRVRSVYDVIAYIELQIQIRKHHAQTHTRRSHRRSSRKQQNSIQSVRAHFIHKNECDAAGSSRRAHEQTHALPRPRCIVVRGDLLRSAAQPTELVPGRTSKICFM